MCSMEKREKRERLLISADRLLLALDVLDFLAYGRTDSLALSRKKVLDVLHNGLRVDGLAIATVWVKRTNSVKGFWSGVSALVRENARLLSDIHLDVTLLLSTLSGEPQAFGKLFRAIACGEITEESFTE